MRLVSTKIYLRLFSWAVSTILLRSSFCYFAVGERPAGLQYFNLIGTSDWLFAIL